jgi:crossover junction endodeoxyribonuclease RuvC
MSSMKTRVLGLDPGFATIGFAVIEGSPPAGLSLVTCGCIRTEAGVPTALRLKEIHRDIGHLIARYEPAVAAVETFLVNRNVTNAIQIGQTRGVLLLALAQADVPIAEYAPNSVKKAVVGYGRGMKAQVQAMVARILKLAEPPRPDDAADAAAVAICHRFTTGPRF